MGRGAAPRLPSPFDLCPLTAPAKSLQDSADNVTRFLVLARDPAVCAPGDARKYRTSVAVALPDGPGALFKALSVFALRGIDMTKVESRPLAGSPAAAAALEGAAGGGPSEP